MVLFAVFYGGSPFFLYDCEDCYSFELKSFNCKKSCEDCDMCAENPIIKKCKKYCMNGVTQCINKCNLGRQICPQMCKNVSIRLIFGKEIIA